MLALIYNHGWHFVQVCVVALEFRNQEASVLRHARLAGAAAGTATSFDSEWEHQLQIWIGELNAQRSSIDESFQKVFFSNIPGRSGGCGWVYGF